MWKNNNNNLGGGERKTQTQKKEKMESFYIERNIIIERNGNERDSWDKDTSYQLEIKNKFIQIGTTF